MCIYASRTLDKDKRGGPDYRDEIEWQPHEVADETPRCEARERAFDGLSEASDGPTGSSRHLAAVLHQRCTVLGQQHGVKDVGQRLIDEELPRECRNDGRRLRQHQRDGRDPCKWSIDECEHERLWYVAVQRPTVSWAPDEGRR